MDEGIFVLKHHKIAVRIGSAKYDPNKELDPKISLIASSFQLNLLGYEQFAEYCRTIGIDNPYSKDEMNNIYGRIIATANPGLSNNLLAEKILLSYANAGLYEAVKNKDGTYNVVQSTLPSVLFNYAMSKLSTLDATGAGEKIRNARAKMQP